MDVEIISERLAATEAAVLKVDERLDAVEEEVKEPEDEAQPDRLLLLEEKLSECLTRLSTMESARAEADLKIAEAEAREAEAQADEAEALSDLIQPPVTAEEPEETLEPEVQEVEPEPESEAVPEKSSNWLEKFLVLR